MNRTNLKFVAPLAGIAVLGLLTCLIGACVSESTDSGLGTDNLTGYGYSSSGYGSSGYSSSGYGGSGHSSSSGWHP